MEDLDVNDFPPIGQGTPSTASSRRTSSNSPTTASPAISLGECAPTPSTQHTSSAVAAGILRNTPPPPLPPAAPLPPSAALRSLLHTRLTVTLTDGRVLFGTLLVIDAAASLLLTNVRERRILPQTPVGLNVAQYYPWSRENVNGNGEADSAEERPGQVRFRELSSVLIPMKEVVGVEIGEGDAESWGRFSGVVFDGGKALPPVVVGDKEAGVGEEGRKVDDEGQGHVHVMAW
ncbi:uncharacterized protein EHS24_001599 [Apiotrichum porosum]|uniref:Uncharacterized protein n=1 Tax=Apiotrichum porosum TaxID=105984 RepID=A0A427XIT7_9TREE|nr:uncharacterized protein EHS24_001599 [Apiotrichum porosum]RSH78703.1 hypothetical protein EHS24_001599 [Apiotrichum porosum]